MLKLPSFTSDYIDFAIVGILDAQRPGRCLRQDERVACSICTVVGTSFLLFPRCDTRHGNGFIGLAVAVRPQPGELESLLACEELRGPMTIARLPSSAPAPSFLCRGALHCMACIILCVHLSPNCAAGGRPAPSKGAHAFLELRAFCLRHSISAQCCPTLFVSYEAFNSCQRPRWGSINRGHQTMPFCRGHSGQSISTCRACCGSICICFRNSAPHAEFSPCTNIRPGCEQEEPPPKG
jgi:hypothetical protein